MANKDEKRKVYSGIKITLNSFISLCVAFVVMLIGIFVIDKYNATFRNSIEYWAQKVFMGVSTFLLMLSMSNITEESRKKHDKDFIDRVHALDEQYVELMSKNRTVELETFIEQINRRNKYSAYVLAIKRKLNHTRVKNVKRVRKLERLLLLTPQEVWDSPVRVKYHKVTFNQMVAGESDVASKDDEYDLLVHKGRYTARKLGIKALTIIACSAVAVDFAFHFAGFTKDMILPLIFKCVSLLIAIYSGVSFGYTIMERRRATVKKKLRIFSQFNERINLTDVSDEERFEIKIPQDIIVEKVRARVEKEDAEERLRAESAHEKDTEIFCEESSNLPTAIPDSDNSHMMTRFLAVK